SVFSFFILAITSSVTWLSCKKPVDFAARESSGMPCRYLLVSSPCANGEKGMQPTPSFSSTSNKLSSASRTNMEHFGLWIPHGVTGFTANDHLIAVAGKIFLQDLAEIGFGRARRRTVIIGKVEMCNTTVECEVQNTAKIFHHIHVAEIVPQAQ